MLLRDGDDGLEVFMLQRTMSASFARGMYVFPGGRVDDADHGEAFEPVCDDVDDAAASLRLGLEHGGLAWMVAAIRECFEEAGVLLARPVDGADVVRFDSDDVVARFSAARHAVHGGELSLVDLCRAERLQLLTDQIHFVDHWVTPVGERRRFDTRFFMTKAPEAQVPLHDDIETIASLWVRPEEALRMWSARELNMFPPTVVSLRRLARFSTASDALADAAVQPRPPQRLPRLVLGPNEEFIDVILPDEAGYEDTPIPEFVIPNLR
jgi:8-oxo-dGTP pyrophosphatase MutT (NUDIX family)